MRVTSIIRGQTVKAVKPSAPFGYFPDAIKALADQYKFVVIPTDLTHLFPADSTKPAPPAIFRHGKLEAQGRTIIIDELQVFQNGIILSTPSSTSDSDLASENVLAWAQSHFDIQFEPYRADGHFSQLEVKFDQALADLFAPLKEIGDWITEALDTFWEARPAYELVGLQFGFDGLKAPKIAPNIFRIERRAEAPFDQNLYFCEAATRTETHMAILDRFERICKERIAVV